MDAKITARQLDVAAARSGCRLYRKRILDISQRVTALHIAPAFSCLEIVDTIYQHLIRRRPDRRASRHLLALQGTWWRWRSTWSWKTSAFCRATTWTLFPTGRPAGDPPDYGLPGIEAATGSLGHGLP